MKYEKEITKGYSLAMSFKPFIGSEVKKHMEVVKDMAKAIDAAINDAVAKNNNGVLPDFVGRVKQLLSALDYEKLTDFQAKCVLLLEKELI